ncbi:putative RNA polymerase I specific transcription initiation factor RRN3 [Helianthus annuus]|uniref:RNA polymerase I specific transcription initiation factor RRN3 n=1 Tax=Helianthus annuus TaxID=4232 RepID=A0A9K3J082_HELAN|nr:putative RNA polymerase I specific transcription initiation factor RRN3 [Helianthus annuus]KAJ0570465.1 putative RNA polymerase I specific transcription initiation factor RRN3 [Helianthus annuus]KAJ0584810.1 putative RNA polymerase I specific transcription initiation factor RRN3 [Helianthus annuus]KAJ0747388.1 putative RNA polymerase I specific transcription initiation factor RRN3 [Helianthus annuus]KAJ0750470.1 putative RNA polymerase I specific transcription initiation factor RRN3 [Heliant
MKVVKQRMQTGHFASPPDVVRLIVAKEGFKGLFAKQHYYRNYGPNVMDALMELLVTLATSNGKYVDLCLDMLVSNFIPPYNFLEILKQPRGLAKKDQVLARVHAALKGIADLGPLAP